MNDPYIPSITCEQFHPTLLVRDLTASVSFYTEKLGFEPGFTWGDPPHLAGVNLGKVSLHLGLGAPGPASASVYFVVDDVEAMYALHEKNGVELPAAPEVKPWGLREYEVRDPDGYTLGFGQHVPAVEPKLEVERVDVPVRLERRLAAVLEDLAAHKRTSVSALLEETLLHSFEKHGDGGVASPHTDSQLALIQHLKKVHGLDYDTHASYRFSEKR